MNSARNLQKTNETASQCDGRPIRGWQTPISLAVFLLAIFGGCQVCPPLEEEVVRADFIDSFFFSASPRYWANPPQKVVIVSTDQAKVNSDLAKTFANSLGAEIKARQLFEVVVPYEFECQTSLDEILSGKFHEPELIQLAKKYNADAVLLVRINEFGHYAPLNANLSLGLLDIREATLLFSADGVWNLNDRPTLQNYEVFLRSNSGGGGPALFQVRKNSPRSFLNYIAQQISEAMIGS